MDQQTFSLLLGIAGLILGFVSAYGKIRLFTIRAAKASGAAARRSLARQDALTALFLVHPSAFIGFIVRRIIWIAFATAIGFDSFITSPLGLIKTPRWAVFAIFLVPWLVAGVYINSLTTVSGNVIKAAKKAQVAEHLCE